MKLKHGKVLSSMFCVCQITNSIWWIKTKNHESLIGHFWNNFDNAKYVKFFDVYVWEKIVMFSIY